MHHIKALIWDMDGTLLNTLDDIIGACNDTLEQWHLPQKNKAEMIQLIGYGARYLCHNASGLNGDELFRFLKAYRMRAMNRDDPQTHIYPGIQQILKEAKSRNLKQGIYTNKPQFWCEKLAHKFFDDDIFDEIIGVQEGSVLKPSGEGIWQMCDHWGIAPSEAVMIGDSTVDWETACNAKCQSICVTWGFRTREVLEKSGATCIVDSWEELAKTIGV